MSTPRGKLERQRERGRTNAFHSESSTSMPLPVVKWRNKYQNHEATIILQLQMIPKTLLNNNIHWHTTTSQRFRLETAIITLPWISNPKKSFNL